MSIFYCVICHSITVLYAKRLQFSLKTPTLSMSFDVEFHGFDATTSKARIRVLSVRSAWDLCL